MKRVSIGRSLGLIAIIGLNLGLARALTKLDRLAGSGLGITIFLFEISVYMVWKSRRGARAFWLGFTLFGILAYLSVVWGIGYPDLIQFHFNTGGPRETHVIPGAVLEKVWMSYAHIAEDKIVPVLKRNGFDGVALERSILFAILVSAVWGLPQMGCALIGSVFFVVVYRIGSLVLAVLSRLMDQARTPRRADIRVCRH